MLWRYCVILFVGTLLQSKPAQCAPAAKGRAYEFGFEIDQNQHRHEKRDENGIVMGEFGFITADGIYHVTVYATDENGRFKILAMKSYPYGNREKKIMIAMIPSIMKTVAVPAIAKAMPTDTKSCGGCIVTKKFAPLPASVAAPLPGAQVFKPLSKAFNGASLPKPSSIPLPPRMPSIPSLQQKPNAIGSGQPKQSPGSSINGKPVQPFGQIPGNRQNKVQSTPQQIDVRLGSQNQTKKVATTGPQYQGNQPSVGGTLNKLFRNLFSSPANNIYMAQQGTHSPQNTFTPKPFQLLNNVPPLTPNTVLQQAPPTSNTIFQQTPRPGVLTPRFGSNNAFTQSQLTNRLPQAEIYSQNPNRNAALHKLTPTTTTQPPTQNTIQPLNTNTLLQQRGFVSSPSTVMPQLTYVGQPNLTNGGLPLRLHLQNTNGAQTPTPELPSTQKLSPSSQSIGKTTPSNNGGGPLYRFNYVLDYNSHREEGRLDGSKEGNYKAIGEDGIRRIIDYIANENGYQPRIKWEPVPPNELPTGENKLKDYEFVWFN